MDAKSSGRPQQLSRFHLLVFLLVVGIAVALRLPGLDTRPMHNDEAVNAIKFGQLWEHGQYKYDPNEHHGPTLIYATLAQARLTGAPGFDRLSEARLRMVTVVFGVGLILLLPLLTDGLGRNGVLWAALFTAVSPAFVFYSDYFIHEALLVFFTLLALGAGWRYWRSRKIGWALLAGVGFGLMDATKETFVIALAAAVFAVVLNQIWNRLIDASGPPVRAERLKTGHMVALLGAWGAVAFLLFSSFFTNPSGPLDSLRTYVPWLNRAEGNSPHLHPWFFYFHRLLFFHPGKGPVWSEALILCLALVGAIAGFRRRQLDGAQASLIRFLAFYTLGLSAFYSFLAYKTPWCLMGFWHGAILLAGVGAAVLLRAVGRPELRAAVCVLVLAGAAHLGWEAWALDTKYPADQRNPYVYAQTSPDILNLVSKVESIAAVTPHPDQLVIKVMAPEEDYWPLPWYLRRFPNVGWWNEVPADPYSPIMIVSAKLHAGLDEKKTHLMVGYFQLRPNVFFELYVEKQLWTDWLASRPKSPPSE